MEFDKKHQFAVLKYLLVCDLSGAQDKSHARRKFVEAEKTAPKIAREAVDLIGRVFAVEKQAKNMSVAERLALRQKQSVPVLAELRQKL